jgi:hypothetical protein
MPGLIGWRFQKAHSGYVVIGYGIPKISESILVHCLIRVADRAD